MVSVFAPPKTRDNEQIQTTIKTPNHFRPSTNQCGRVTYTHNVRLPRQHNQVWFHIFARDACEPRAARGYTKCALTAKVIRSRRGRYWAYGLLFLVLFLYICPKNLHNAKHVDARITHSSHARAIGAARVEPRKKLRSHSHLNLNNTKQTGKKICAAPHWLTTIP